MGIFAVLLLTVFGIVCIEAGKKCHGDPLMYNGKRCASTTWYADGRKGACGCGPDHNDNQFDWNHRKFTAAANQHFFDPGLKTWCGAKCGTCVLLTTTGGFVDGQGDHVAEGQQHVFMVTNLCPNEWPNLSWCSQSSHNGYKNHYGYSEHFDLEDGAGQIAAIGWKGKNPEVTWEYVDCNWVSTICDVGRPTSETTGRPVYINNIPSASVPGTQAEANKYNVIWGASREKYIRTVDVNP